MKNTKISKKKQTDNLKAATNYKLVACTNMKVKFRNWKVFSYQKV